MFPLRVRDIKGKGMSPWVSNLVSAAPNFAPSSPESATILKKRLVIPKAPLASTIDGAHILLQNDVDSVTPKFSFLLLSKPRSYYDAAAACKTMFDKPYTYLPGMPASKELLSLLKSNAAAQPETAAATNYWVLNGFPNFGCISLNKTSGWIETTPCTKKLPIICTNSAPRRTVLVQDVTRQVVVDAAVGKIQGFRDQNSFRFLGIRYAEAPVGELRFAAPVAKAPSKSIVDATAFGYICPQNSHEVGLTAALGPMIHGALQDEDCLSLNVFTPSLKSKAAKGLPVMVYIHGGAFSMFSGSTIIYEPGNLVSRGGVVVVTFNYRLGMLGFTENAAFQRSDIPGNQAIHDQILALRWVKDHIANFGGDPARVTLFGESAGAVSIRALLSAPSAWNLYTNVISQSDPIDIPFKSPEDAGELTTYFFNALKCPTADIQCARSKPISDILAADAEASKNMLAAQNWTTVALIYRPTVDSLLISAEFSDLVQSGQYNTKANIMWGTTRDEAGRFVETYIASPYAANPDNYDKVFLGLLGSQRQKAFIQSGLIEKYQPTANSQELLNYFYTAFYFSCPIQYLGRKIASNFASVSNSNRPSPQLFSFRFDRGRELPLIDANGTFCGSANRICHAKDIIPIFGSGAAVPFIPQTGDDARFSRQIIDRATTFAKIGNPNPTGSLVGVENLNKDVTGIQWLPYDDRNPTLELDLQSRMVIEGNQELCTFFEKEINFDFVVRNPSHPTMRTELL
ncbi:hypothetical protein EC991_008656 [Linnemannia zychae]|nr:hypothetical protein EC991_008656 [Linnemannia zychae]